MADNNLLTPTLERELQMRAIYSVGALIAAAFFGGGAAVALLAAINSGRLSRLRRDALWIVPALLVAIVIPLVVLHMQPQGDETGISSDVRLYVRAFGFGLVGLAYLMHRDAYRTMQTVGMDPPKPWVPAIAVSLAGIALTLLTVILYRSFVA
jgi:hypothetical protein